MSTISSLVISGPSATFRYRVGNIVHQTEDALYVHDVRTYETIKHAEAAKSGTLHRNPYLQCGVMIWTPDMDEAAELMRRLQRQGVRLE